MDSVIRGYHVYKNIWVTIIGETLFCEQEPGNKEDHFAVAGHQLLKYLGTFNWKIWLACRTLE